MRPELDLKNLPSRRFEPLRYAVGAWTEHIFFAFDLIAALQPGVLVELGTDRGESYFAFCQSIKENATATRSSAIDHWQGDSHAGTYDQSTYHDVLSHNSKHYAEFSTLIRSSFDDALDRFARDSIGLLHIDGHHTEEAARHDVESWLPKLRPGGILLLHDIAVRERDFGVWKVWSALAERGRSFAFSSSPGLGVWEKPPAGPQPALLETLFAPPNESRIALLGYYARRNAALHEILARQWRDGTIRWAPLASETVVQVFWMDDGHYAEERSASVRIGHQAWKNVEIPLRPGGLVRGLRIDFFSALTIVEVAEIAATAGGELIYRAVAKEKFEAISLGGDCVRISAEPFLLQITGVDPQLYLPPFSPPIEADEVIVRLKLRVHEQRPPA